MAYRRLCCAQCMSANLRLHILAEGSFSHGLDFLGEIEHFPADLSGDDTEGLWLQEYLPADMCKKASYPLWQ